MTGRLLRSFFRTAPVALVLLGATCAHGLVRFDFEQKFYVHPGQQTWDFSVIRADSIYHIYYHTAPEIPTGSRTDTIWHATSPDLVRWELAGPILPSGTGDWDARSVWAPDVFRDEANGRWVIAYTGADSSMNQSLGLAYSDDLFDWTQEAANPVLTPDPSLYIWGPERVWSDFRDPYVWRQDDQWHVLVTARQWQTQATGVLYHAVSDDLLQWQDVGVFFSNDGDDPGRVLESPQYHVLNGRHHLLFGEFDTVGLSHVAAPDPSGLTMADRTFIDNGYAPEVDSFDAGVHVLSRITPFQQASGSGLSYVVRFDTLLVSPDGSTLTPYKPHPLDADWEVHTGLGALGNPTFGDNPLWRGEPSSGLLGHGWFGSGEHYQGPLSGYGYPGAMLGGSVTCELASRPFVVTGDRMTLLVGGAEDAANLYVALVDAATDSVLRRETGRGTPVMDAREWSLADLVGRLCRIRIVDAATGSLDVLNVDEIVEHAAPKVAGTASAPAVLRHRAYPNPANPRLRVRFELARTGIVRLRIHDLRGRRIWSGAVRTRAAGSHELAWTGRDRSGRAVASGLYLYVVEIDGRPGAAGKFSLLR